LMIVGCSTWPNRFEFPGKNDQYIAKQNQTNR